MSRHSNKVWQWSALTCGACADAPACRACLPLHADCCCMCFCVCSEGEGDAMTATLQMREAVRKAIMQVRCTALGCRASIAVWPGEICRTAMWLRCMLAPIPTLLEKAHRELCLCPHCAPHQLNGAHCICACTCARWGWATDCYCSSAVRHAGVDP